MSFRPSIHGWPFGNVHSCAAPSLGLGARPLPELGVGGGLCWTALDRYLRGVRIDRHTPAPEAGDPLYDELVRRQMAALSGVWPRVHDWQSRSAGSWRDRLPVRVPGGDDLASRTRREWPAIRRSLKAGRPVLLTLLSEADPYSRGRAAWQVLATAYRRERSRVTVSVYDPSVPGDDNVRLGFELAGRLDARLTGGREVRGFFAVPYDRSVPASVRAETFADRSVIGLNRKVRATPDITVARRRLDLVARDTDGALLHFRRSPRGRWEGTNITERFDLGAEELHSEPRAAVGPGGRLHVFARNYVGDLLHFRSGRKWRVSNRTDTRRAGPRFRLAGAPIALAGPRLRLSVLGLDENGGLIHYAKSPGKSWMAEQVPGEALTAEPCAVWIGPVLHVIGTGEEGRVVAWELENDRWTTTDLTVGKQSGPAVRLAGRPSLHVDDETLHVFGRDTDGRLFRLARTGVGTWTGTILAGDVVGDPVVTGGPAGMHVFAAARGGGLLHAWRDGDWRTEDIVATRPTVAGDGGDLGERLLAWGSGDELHVYGERRGDVIRFAWRSDADWTVERLMDHTGVDPVRHTLERATLVEDGAGRPHLVGTDGRGSVLHVETGAWLEPGKSAAPEQGGRRSRARAGAAARPGKVETAADGAPAADEADAAPAAPAPETAPAAEPEAGSEVEPLPMLDESPEGGWDEAESQPDDEGEAVVGLTARGETEGDDDFERMDLTSVTDDMGLGGAPEQAEDEDANTPAEDPETEEGEDDDFEVEVLEVERISPEKVEPAAEVEEAEAELEEAEAEVDLGEDDLEFEEEDLEFEEADVDPEDDEVVEIAAEAVEEALDDESPDEEPEGAGAADADGSTDEEVPADIRFQVLDDDDDAEAEDPLDDLEGEDVEPLPYLDFEDEGAEPAEAEEAGAVEAAKPSVDGAAAKRNGRKDAPKTKVADAEAADAEGDAAEEPAETPAAKKEYSWEREAGESGGAPPDIEPMDLALLDTWPTPPPSMRKSRDKKKSKEKGKKREAS